MAVVASTRQGSSTRIESSAVAVSWIPMETVELGPRALFELGIDAYDHPPPERLDDVDALHRAGGFRTANELRVWVDVDKSGAIVGYGQTGRTLVSSSRLHLSRRSVTFAGVAFPDLERVPAVHADGVTFHRTAGGRTGLPAPRRVKHPPFMQLAAPPCWTTVALTVRADGTATATLEGASEFPRHWLYDDAGMLVAKTGLVSFEQWWRAAFGASTPWGGDDTVPVVWKPESSAERAVSPQVMAEHPQIRVLEQGETLVEQGDAGSVLFVVLDGTLVIERDGVAVVEVGPGAVLGEEALLTDGLRTATIRASRRCRVAVAPAGAVGADGIAAVAHAHGLVEAHAPTAATASQLSGRTGGRVPAQAARTFEEFYAGYLDLHRHAATRAMHALGWASAAALLVRAARRRRLRDLAVAFGSFAAPPALSHVVIERNSPATGRPIWELRADVRMIRTMLGLGR